MFTVKVQDLYTSGKPGEEILSCYNLEGLLLDRALVKLNKVSDNGISLTVATRLTAPFKSAVSKSAKEKGVQPVELDKGDILVFQLNQSLKDDRKPDEVNGRAQTLMSAFTGKAKKSDEVVTLHDKTYKEGEIVLLTFDGSQIPLKGLLNMKSFKSYLEDYEDSIIHIEAIDVKITGELSEDELEVIETLKSSKAPVQGNYQQRKSFKDIFAERLTFVREIMNDPKGEVILEIASYFNETVDWTQEEDETEHWSAQGDTNTAMIISKILSP